MKKRVFLLHNLIYLVNIIIVSELLCILGRVGRIIYFNLVTSLFYHISLRTFLLSCSLDSDHMFIQRFRVD